MRLTLAWTLILWLVVAHAVSADENGHRPDREPALPGGTPLDEFALQMLGASPEMLARWQAAEQADVLEVRAVDLPRDVSGDCNHWGWPIATMTGDTLVVMHRRIPGHNPQGAGQADASISYGIVLTSSDGGRTWSKPYDLRDCMRPEDRHRGGIVPLSHRYKFDSKNPSREGYKIHLHAIGTMRDGAVVAMNNHGVFRSQDTGKTWKHFSTALREDTFPHKIVNLGPNLFDHPQQGLLAFGNWLDTPRQFEKQFVVLRSPDGGAKWQVEEHPIGLPQYEPAALWNDGRFLLVTRDESGVSDHKQINWQPGGAPRVTSTNLKDPRYMDTVDLSYNPVTRRLELIRSERYRMELWLWSMDPADWATGQWRRECQLLAREGKFYTTADGFHPAGAVIDAKRGVQHIFIYTGHPNGPAGVFRITRSLDTPKLREFLKHE